MPPEHVQKNDVTFKLSQRRLIPKIKGSYAVFHGEYRQGSFDCIFAVFDDFDPKKLVLYYEDWGDYGYMISSAAYNGNKDDFCFHDGEFIRNLNLKFV